MSPAVQRLLQSSMNIHSLSLSLSLCLYLYHSLCYSLNSFVVLCFILKFLCIALAQKLKSPDFSLRAAYNSPLHPLTPIRSLAKGATPSLTPSHPISSPKLNLTPVVEINRKKRKFSSEPPPPDSFQRSLTDNLLFIPPASNTTKNNTNTPDTNKNNSHSRNESEKNEKNDQKVLNANKEKNVNEEIEKQLRDKLESQHRQQQSQ
jgi:hypothetical protein